MQCKKKKQQQVINILKSYKDVKLLIWYVRKNQKTAQSINLSPQFFRPSVRFETSVVAVMDQEWGKSTGGHGLSRIRTHIWNDVTVTTNF